MLAAWPSIRAAILLTCNVTWLLTAACAPKQPGALVGVSRAVPDAPAPPTPVAPRPVWPDFAAARAWPEASPKVVALAHRRDGTLIHVRVEPGALDQYLALAVDAPMPDGARIAAFHESPAGELLGAYLLVKRASAWSALELDGQGAVIAGDRAACLRCHDLAPTDHLFGVTSRQATVPVRPGN